MGQSTNAALKLVSATRARSRTALFVSMGTNTIDPDDAGPLFEMPIPLPERLDFIP